MSEDLREASQSEQEEDEVMTSENDDEACNDVTDTVNVQTKLPQNDAPPSVSSIVPVAQLNEAVETTTHTAHVDFAGSVTNPICNTALQNPAEAPSTSFTTLTPPAQNVLAQSSASSQPPATSLTASGVTNTELSNVACAHHDDVTDLSAIFKKINAKREAERAAAAAAGELLVPQQLSEDDTDTTSTSGKRGRRRALFGKRRGLGGIDCDKRRSSFNLPQCSRIIFLILFCIEF